MYQLWKENDINNHIEPVCNNLRIRFDTLLTLSLEEIIDRAIYNIDPGIMIKSVRSGVPEHVKDAQRGIYRSVYIYDYSELYRIIMMNSDQRVISELALRLSGAPSKLIVTGFYFNYVARDKLLPKLYEALSGILNGGKVIALEPFIIRSIGPLTGEWLPLRWGSKLDK